MASAFFKVMICVYVCEKGADILGYLSDIVIKFMYIRLTASDIYITIYYLHVKL